MSVPPPLPVTPERPTALRTREVWVSGGGFPSPLVGVRPQLALDVQKLGISRWVLNAPFELFSLKSQSR